MAGPGRPGPDPLPREHASTRGYYQHKRHNEKPCPLCALARSEYDLALRERHLREYAEARRARRAGGAR